MPATTGTRAAVPDQPPTPAATTPVCPHCGAPLTPPGRFCTACGQAATAEHGPAPEGAAGGTGTAPVAAAASGGDRAAGGEAGAGHRADPDALPPPASGRGATRRCTSCGAANPRTRELCVRCGLDLDPDERTAVPPRAPLLRPRPRRGARVLRRWWMLVGAVLVAVPLVVSTVLFVAGLGPFADQRDAPLDPVTFPVERYPVMGEALPLSDVATLTTAPPHGDRRFRAEALVDGDPTTAWRSDPASRPAEVPETIDLLLARPAWVTALAISNGDHHDLDAYERAGRIATAELVFDGEVRVRARLQDLGRQRQLLTLEEPVLSTAVRLEITEVVTGTHGPAVAVSSVELRGHLAEGEDVDLAEQRARQRPAAGTVVVRQPGELPVRLPLSRPAQGS